MTRIQWHQLKWFVFPPSPQQLTVDAVLKGAVFPKERCNAFVGDAHDLVILVRLTDWSFRRRQ